MFLRAAARSTKAATLLCVDTLLKSTAKGRPRHDCVLIVRLDHIGDFILWLNAAQALVDYYRAAGKNTVLVANAAWASWAGDLAIFDEIIAVDDQKFQQNLLYRYRIGREIRRHGCTVAVDPAYSRRWLVDDSVIRVSGAKVRIRSMGDKITPPTWQRRIADRWYTHSINSDPSPLMELERNAEFVRNLAGIDFQAKIPRLDPAKSLRTDDAFTSAIAGQPYFVLFPGARSCDKQWPASSFIAVAEKLHDRTGWQGVVCGGSSDLQLAESLCRESAAPLLNWADRTDLAELAAILSAARLVLTNDTAAVHMATACGVPTVCLLGGGHYGRFLPYQLEQQTDRPLPHVVVYPMPCFGCAWQCIYKTPPSDPVPCIERIPVDAAWHAISQVLGLPE